jgi:hypothetical protein
VKDDKGQVTHLIIHQGGRDSKAKRMSPNEAQPREPEKAKSS